MKFNRLFAETRCSCTQLRHLGHFASQEIAASGPVAQCSELAADNSLVGKFESSQPNHAFAIERRFPELTVNDRDMAGLRESGSVSAIDYPSGWAVLPSYVSAGEKPFPGNGDLRRTVRMSDVVGRRPPYRNFESGGRGNFLKFSTQEGPIFCTRSRLARHCRRRASLQAVSISSLKGAAVLVRVFSMSRRRARFLKLRRAR